MEINQKIKSITENFKELTKEYKEKIHELDKLKRSQIDRKNEYNQAIKSYQNITSLLINIEKSIYMIDHKMNKYKTKKSLIYYSVNEDFVKDFMKDLSLIPKNIADVIFSFFGLKLSSIRSIATILNDDVEMRSFLRNSDKMFHIYESNIARIKEVLYNFKNINLVFPFNKLCDYILFHIEIIELENEREHLIEKQDKYLVKQNKAFLLLKMSETDIVRIDNVYCNTKNYMKTINFIKEKYDQINEMDDGNLKTTLMSEFLQKLENFRNLNISSLRKTENFSTLTLKSEYSQDISGFLKESSVENFSDFNESIDKCSFIKEEVDVKTRQPVSLIKIRSIDLPIKSDEKIIKKDIKKSKTSLSLKKTKLIEMKSTKKLKATSVKNNVNDFLTTPQNYLSGDLITGVNVDDKLKKDKVFFNSRKMLIRHLKDSSVFEKYHDIPKENEENLFENIIPNQQQIVEEDKLIDIPQHFEIKQKENSINSDNNMSNQGTRNNNLQGTLMIKTQIQTSNPLAHSLSSSSKYNLTLVKQLPTSYNTFKSNDNDWVISTMRKNVVMSSRILSDVTKKKKSSLDYRNLKMDINDVKNSGCCVSCV